MVAAAASSYNDANVRYKRSFLQTTAFVVVDAWNRGGSDKNPDCNVKSGGDHEKLV